MNYEETIQKWRGDDLNVIPEPETKYHHTLQQQMVDQIGGFTAPLMIKLFQPTPSEQKGPSMVAIWESAEKRSRDMRLRMRPGKAFKKMFPWLTQVELAQIGDWYRELMLLNDSEIVIRSSTLPEHFKLAYAGEQAPMANPSTTCDRKVLSYSCMRYSFDDLPAHPAEVFASGDFTIVWAEILGKIAGRCVIYDKKAGPIYGVSDTVLDALATHIYDKLGAISFDEHDGWEGARLRKIEYHGGLIGPYLDVEPQSASDHGDHLVISYDGNLELDEIDGTLGGGCTCSECNSSIDEEECSTDHNGNSYCESCWSDLFAYCESCDQDGPRDESQEVFMATRHGTQSQYWCESCRSTSASYCENEGEYWRDEDTCQTHDYKTISVKDYEDNYTTCCLTDEIYHNDDVAPLANGEGYASVEHLRSDGEWKENEDGEWENVQSELALVA